MAIYMPVSPLAVAAMLACARIGAVHTVVFAGFSAESLAGRINDGEPLGGREKPGGPWPLFLGPGHQGFRVETDINTDHTDKWQIPPGTGTWLNEHLFCELRLFFFFCELRSDGTGLTR